MRTLCALRCHPYLEEYLRELVNRKLGEHEPATPCATALTHGTLVDHLIHYTPRAYSVPERASLVSSRAEGLEGPVDTIGAQFFNELAKREAGRSYLLGAGCSHFLLMDCDEFYLEEELRNSMRIIVERGVHSSCTHECP